MAKLTNEIERYIKALIEQSGTNTIEIKRNELAIELRCVPSQINYVLQTRFSPERGYKVESQRGGGGYIRVTRINYHAKEMILHLTKNLEQGISHNQCKDVLKRLEETGIFTKREGRILVEITSASVLKIPLPIRDKIRADILRQALINVIEESWR